MAAEDGRELFRIERALLDEPRNAVVVPRASDLKANGREMFSGEDAGGDAIHVALDGPGQCLLDERRAGRNELDGPAFDGDVLPVRCKTAGEQVIVNGAERGGAPPGEVGSTTKTPMSCVVMGSSQKIEPMAPPIA